MKPATLSESDWQKATADVVAWVQSLSREEARAVRVWARSQPPAGELLRAAQTVWGSLDAPWRERLGRAVPSATQIDVLHGTLLRGAMPGRLMLCALFAPAELTSAAVQLAGPYRDAQRVVAFVRAHPGCVARFEQLASTCHAETLDDLLDAMTAPAVVAA